MVPDVLADFIDARLHTDDNPLDWYYRTALAAIEEVRAARNRDRHLQLAKRYELPSYYQYRTIIVQEAGYKSLWHYRQEQGWGENRSPRWKPRLHLQTTLKPPKGKP